MAGSLSIAVAFVFMLVVATTTANPVHNEEKLMSNQDPVKAIRYFWNEDIGKDRSAQAINVWNDIIEEDQKKNFYTMRDDSEDGDKEKDGDRDQNGDKDKGTLKPINLWNKGKVNNEGWFKAKIEAPVRGRRIAVIIIVILTAHACMLVFFFHPCIIFRLLDQALQLRV